MRSLLVQASSVEKAVEKAWADAGMPTNFTIKILDFGEKGFLGMVKKNAIISILYEPKNQTSTSIRRVIPTEKTLIIKSITIKNGSQLAAVFLKKKLPQRKWLNELMSFFIAKLISV